MRKNYNNVPMHLHWIFKDAAELVIDTPVKSCAIHVKSPESFSLSTLVMCKFEFCWYLLVVFVNLDPKTQNSNYFRCNQKQMKKHT